MTIKHEFFCYEINYKQTNIGSVPAAGGGYPGRALEKMNYKDNYSKNDKYMASSPAQKPVPRRPQTNRPFDPSGMNGEPAKGQTGPKLTVSETVPVPREPNEADIPRSRAAERSSRSEASARRTGPAKRGRTVNTASTVKSARKVKTGKTGSNVKAAGPVRVVLAAVSGLICSAIVLLTCSGLYGMWCFSKGLPGDINVQVSTAMYCLAALCGGLWAGAVVRRRSVAPAVIIAAVFMVLSIAVSLQLFEPAAVKPGMVVFKLLLTVAAVFAGFGLSVLPYLLRRKRK